MELLKTLGLKQMLDQGLVSFKARTDYGRKLLEQRLREFCERQHSYGRIDYQRYFFPPKVNVRSIYHTRSFDDELSDIIRNVERKDKENEEDKKDLFSDLIINPSIGTQLCNLCGVGRAMIYNSYKHLVVFDCVSQHNECVKIFELKHRYRKRH